MIKNGALILLFSLGCHQLLAQRIFWTESNTGQIMVADLTSSSIATPSTFITGLNGPRNLAVDIGSGRLFHDDNFGEDIHEADLSDGSALSTVITTGGMVYFVDFAYSENDDALFGSMNTEVHGVFRIPANNNNSGGEESLPLSGFDNDDYIGVIVDDGSEIVYMVNADQTSILSTNFSGTGGGFAVTLGEDIQQIALDRKTGILYFTAYEGSPAFQYKIYSFDGSDVEEIASLGNNEITSIQVYSQFNKIYFVQSDAIRSMDLNTGGIAVERNLAGAGVSDIAIEGDFNPPVINALSPPDNASNIPLNSNLGITFNENVKVSATAGTAAETSIRVYRTSDNTVMETIPRSSGSISIVNNVVTVSGLTNVSENSIGYHVQIGSKVFSDVSNNDYFGIANATSWNFTTVPGVTITTAANTSCVGSYVTLPNIVITEAANSNFAVGTNVTMVLGFSAAGYSFQAGTGSVTFTSSRNITAATIGVTATNITVTYTVTGTTLQDGLTLSGLKFTTTNAVNPPVNIVRTGGTGGIGGLITNTVVGTVNSTAAPGVPAVTYPLGPNVCQGTGVGVTLVNATGTNTKWYNDLALTSEITTLAGLNAATGTALGISSATPATFTKYVTQTVGTCESVPSTMTITIDPPPTAANAGGDLAICSTATPLAANAPTSGTGLWSIQSGTGGTIANTTSPTSNFTGIAGNTYVLLWTVSNGTCTPSSNDVIIKFDATPTVSVPGSTQTVCGTSTTLAANTPTIGTGLWTIVSGVGGNIVTPSSPTSVFTGTAGATYVLAWTISNGSCTASTNNVSIQFFGAPTTASAGPPQTVCGTSVVLAGNVPTTGTGQWSVVNGTGGTFSAATNPVSGFTGTAGSVYTLRWTISSGSCTPSTSDVLITLIANPTTAAAGPDQDVCASSAVLAGNTPLIGSGEWSVVTGTGGVIADPSSPSSGFTGNAGSPYVLRWTTSNAGCPPSTNDVSIVFLAPPTTASAGDDQVSCNTSVNLAGNTPVSGTGAWSVISGAGGNIVTPASPVSSFTGVTGTTYVLRWTISRTGCTASTDDVSIQFNSFPTGSGSITGLAALCPGVSGTYTVSGITNASSYDWQLPAGLELVSQNGQTATIKGVSDSGGTITVTGENSCGQGGSAKTDVAVLPLPEITILFPQDIVINEAFTFDYSSASSITTQRWTFGDGAGSDEAKPEHTYTSSGDFTVGLEVEDDKGCTNVASQGIFVNPEAELSNYSIKNVVTANGDDRNKFLYIERIDNFEGTEVIVLDRMGVEVFRKKNYQNDWDLRKGEEYLPAGNYVCVVKYQGNVYSRSVTVLKGH